MSGDQAGNVRRLRVLMTLFDISIQDIARAGGVSRPLVSGLLAGKPNIRANGLFTQLELNLGVLIGTKRRRPYFDLPGIPADEAEAVVNTILGAARTTSTG